MYRIFCESYDNYIRQNNENDYRSKLAEPFALIVNINKYNLEKEKETLLYKQLCDLLNYMENNIENYPRFNAFLWTLESRNLKGEYYGVTTEEELCEQAKLVNMFLKLVYWDVA